MPSPIVVLAHAPHAQAIAHRVSNELSELGYAIDRKAGATRRAQAARIENAHKVVVLWSRAARGTPALRAAVRRARAKGTLVCVALDGAPPPAGAIGAKRLPRNSDAWRKTLLSKRQRASETTIPRAQPRPARARRDPKLRVTKQFAQRPLPPPQRRGAPVLTAALTLVFIAAAAGVEAYARDPNIAQRVAEMAAQFTAER